MNLEDKLLGKQAGLLFYGIAPPKAITSEEKVASIADTQIKRLKNLQLDGLVLYDVQNEDARTAEPRPFPYIPTLSPEHYGKEYLQALHIPKIFYKSVGSFSPETFKIWLEETNEHIEYAVFVGSPSKNHEPALTLQEAYEIRKQTAPHPLLGGVTIPERHEIKKDEHRRVANKIESGCTFFISQCVYNVANAKKFLDDYNRDIQREQTPAVPIIFTLTPCGSAKTLQFMEWLGISIPAWMKEDLKKSSDLLSRSVELCIDIAKELLKHGKQTNIPVGFNIESVSIRKEEIDASIQLVEKIKTLSKRS